MAGWRTWLTWAAAIAAGGAAETRGGELRLGKPTSARRPSPLTVWRPVAARSPVARAQSPSDPVTQDEVGRWHDPLLGPDPEPPIRDGGVKQVSFTEAEAEEAYNCGAVLHGDDDAYEVFFGERLRGFFAGDDGDEPYFDDVGPRRKFASDSRYARRITPVTNPFLFESPYALTEARGLFLHQSIPDDVFLYGGGDIQFYGLQARIALTERWSVVLHKLGFLSINPGTETAGLSDETGFSEIHIGPKFTFWRGRDGGFAAAAGLIFQIPTGPDEVFQNTGDLSLVPYGTLAKTFFRTRAGSLTFMDTFGVSLSTDDLRSDFLYNSAHLSLNFRDRDWFYPLVELNWFHYTEDGTARPLTPFEGGDLANVGAPAEGRDFLTLAFGSRFRFLKRWEFGVAAEFPLLGTEDLLDFRLSLDLIWRY